MALARRDNGRLRLRVAQVNFTFADVGGAVGTEVVRAFEMPAGAILVGGALVITTAYTTTDTTTLAVGDITTADRYLAATDIEAAARTALVPTGFVITETQPAINFTVVVSTSVNTAGAGYVYIEYVIRSRRSINLDNAGL